MPLIHPWRAGELVCEILNKQIRDVETETQCRNSTNAAVRAFTRSASLDSLSYALSIDAEALRASQFGN